MKDIKELVSSFKEKTNEMLECIKHEEYDKLLVLLSERKEIINYFEEKNEVYNKSEIVAELKSSGIMELDMQLSELISQNMRGFKEKIQNINSDDLLKKAYSTGFSGNPLLLNKKIY
jgi:hypothetical protein